MKTVYAIIALTLTALQWGCSRQANGTANEVIRIDGSSTVFLLSEAVTKQYLQTHNQRITIGVSGTGGGMTKFCSQELDITGASRIITQEERDLCAKNGVEYIELRAAYDGITFVVPSTNRWVDYLSKEELRTIWEPNARDRITRWNQVRPEFPDRPLNLYGPGSVSGTFDYFTEVIVGQEKASRSDYKASEDDHVLVDGISNDRDSLGYFGFAYFHANRDILRAIPIGPSPEKTVLPTQKSISQLSYKPLSRPIFIYINAESAQSERINEFVEFYLDQAGPLAEKVGYVRLPIEEKEAAQQHFAERKIGSLSP